MNVFRLRPDAVDVVEMAELRFESRSSLDICEMRLWAGDSGCSPLRTARVPLGSRDSLCGKLGWDEELALVCLAALVCRWDTGGVLILLGTSASGCRFFAAATGWWRRFRSAMVR